MSDDEDWGLDDFDAPEQPTGGEVPSQPQGGTPQGSQEPPPVKLSRGKTGLLIVGLLIIVVIILITIKGCSVEKKTNEPQNQGSTNSTVISNISGGENNGGNGVKNPDISGVSQPMGSTPLENPNVPNNPDTIGENPGSIPNTITPSGNVPSNPSTESTTVGEPSSSSSGGNATIGEPPLVTEGILTEVGVPQLSTEIETNGIVVGKHVYYYNGSYVYGVYVSILFGDATKSVYYFCPRKTFDALHSADAIKVTYSFDSAGNVSITSITK